MEKPDKSFYDNREFKVLFRCRQCKFSMHESVAKLPCGEVTVAKLPSGEVTGNRCRVEDGVMDCHSEGRGLMLI